MASFRIKGGNKLHGSITPQGAKNEALQVLCACLLTQDEVTMHNVPQIADVLHLIELLEKMGVSVQRIDQHSYRFKANQVNTQYMLDADFYQRCTTLRGSVMLIGPMLARYGHAILPQPGGDKIGRRHLDTHFEGLCKLGATFSYNANLRLYEVTAEKLNGCYMLLDEASVTGTANIVMAAVLAKGTTTIYNAACEPYLQQLCKMLNNMGAKIEGIGSNLLHITGVESLHGCTHTILPDMIEVGSFIGMAAMTGSEILIKNVSLPNLGIIPQSFRKLGIEIIEQGDDILVPAQDHFTIQSYIDGSILTIADAPWPGLTPDLISVLLVVATKAKGSVLIHQKMFESRLFFVDKLIDMGAQIILCDPHRASIIGLGENFHLRPAVMSSPDIRAGIALLIAALSADGVSTIHNIEQIDRGYENIDQRLTAIGACIERI
ncbi:MAG: UDP-N-acetylglucosamine 1-carboxyvinyltransferase [Paludibacteraceae bacterium]|jgi:UDP-N-acetylglucosamine 1-carboxyvinyltransferase|nr:UDP-N-acetylglucosamine 1-carboxyvinyltransferase [Paludibacteraceae bacterium]